MCFRMEIKHCRPPTVSHIVLWCPVSGRFGATGCSIRLWLVLSWTEEEGERGRGREGTCRSPFTMLIKMKILQIAVNREIETNEIGEWECRLQTSGYIRSYHSIIPFEYSDRPTAAKSLQFANRQPAKMGFVIVSVHGINHFYWSKEP